MKKKNLLGTVLVGVLAFALVGCGGAAESKSDDKTITIGVSPVPHKEIVEEIKPDLEAKGYKVVIKEFTDYVTPNTALSEGSLDANFFQHIPYLNDQNQTRGLNLDYTAQVHLETLGAYSKTIKDIKELKDGATIAIPNDPSNEARALNLLAENGIIKVKEGELITPKDIIENPKNLKFSELEAAAIPKALEDVDLAIINGNYAIDAGFKVNKDALIKENKDSEASKPYGNVIAVKKENKDTQKIKDLTEALTSENVKDFINNKYEGNVIPVF
ncbi:MAG: MetQ/NlpA family ABC transporter substrate-binding protein [Clostridium sp.]